VPILTAAPADVVEGEALPVLLEPEVDVKVAAVLKDPVDVAVEFEKGATVVLLAEPLLAKPPCPPTETMEEALAALEALEAREDASERIVDSNGIAVEVV